MDIHTLISLSIISSDISNSSKKDVFLQDVCYLSILRLPFDERQHLIDQILAQDCIIFLQLWKMLRAQVEDQ